MRSWACKCLVQIHPCKPPQQNRKFRRWLLVLALLGRVLMWLITAYEHNCSPSKIKKARETHWWNRKLEKLRKETRERFRRAKKGNMEQLWNLSNATRNAYRKEIREAKGKSCTSFCSNIDKGAEAARLNRLMARNPGAM